MKDNRGGNGNLAGDGGDGHAPGFMEKWADGHVARAGRKTTGQKFLDDPGSCLVLKCEGCGATFRENSKARKCPGCGGFLARYHSTTSCIDDPRHAVRPGDTACRSCGGNVRVVEERA